MRITILFFLIVATAWGQELSLPECNVHNRGTVVTRSYSQWICMDGWVATCLLCSVAPEDVAPEDHSALYFALRSRVLTDAEMSRVEQLGESLIAGYGAYRYIQLNAALLQQFKLRKMTEKYTITSSPIQDLPAACTYDLGERAFMSSAQWKLWTLKAEDGEYKGREAQYWINGWIAACSGGASEDGN